MDNPSYFDPLLLSSSLLFSIISYAALSLALSMVLRDTYFSSFLLLFYSIYLTDVI